MKYRSGVLSLFWILFSLNLTACVPDLTPIQVAERFWTAIKNKDKNEIKKYIASGTISGGESDNLLPLDEVKLGRIVIEGDEAWVDTTVIIEGEDPFQLPLETVLLKEEGQWKVNYDATVETLSKDNAIAKAIGGIAELSTQFADNLDKSLEEIQKAIPEVQREIEKIEDGVKKHLPELQKKLDEFIRQLEEALQDFDKDAEPRGTIEI